jgi:hypothetical protein
MASTPLPGYTEELRRHSPHSEATIKRSGEGVTLYCVCGARLVTTNEQVSLNTLQMTVAQHARLQAEQAVS